MLYARGCDRHIEEQVRMGMRMYRLKRSLNNLAFRMSIVKLAPGSSRPLLPLAMILIVGFTTFVTAGGLFILVQPNTPLVNRPGGFSFVYPGDIHNQTTREALLSIVTFGMGILILLIALFIGLRYSALHVKLRKIFFSRRT